MEWKRNLTIECACHLSEVVGGFGFGRPANSSVTNAKYTYSKDFKYKYKYKVMYTFRNINTSPVFKIHNLEKRKKVVAEAGVHKSLAFSKRLREGEGGQY